MATTVPPKRGVQYVFEVALVSVADTDNFQANPTLAAGDVVVYKDGALDGNIDALPAAIGAGKVITVTLSVAEMTADRIAVLFSDVAGDQWQDLLVVIETVTTSQIDDLATASALATVDTNVDAVLADTGTDGVVLATGAVSAAAIADNAIDADAIAANAITAAKIATGAIDADAIADNAIDAGAIAADAITAAKIATGAIDADAIADNAIDAGAIAANAITAAKIATGAITSDELGATALTAIANAVRDVVIEGTYTLRHFVRLMGAVLFGKSSGGGTAAIKFRDTADGTDRIDATVDSAGNRTAVTLDET